MAERTTASPDASGGDAVCVALAADNIMSKGAGAAALSVAARLAEHGRRGRVFIVDCGLSATSRRRVAVSLRDTTSSLTWLTVSGEAAGLLSSLSDRSTRPYPPAAYARLLLPALLPDDVSRVIYLDADMIVRSDIGRLWDEGLDGMVVGAVRDLPLRNGNAERIARTVDQDRYPYDPLAVYYQSGLLMMDIAAFRAERIADRAFELLRAYPTLQFPDQDALNALLATRTRMLDPRWNQMSAVYAYPDHAIEPSPFDDATLRALQTDPFIVHFSGRPKPWEPGCRHPLVGEWFDALDRTGWRGWRPTRYNAVTARLPRIVRKVRRGVIRTFAST